jgi:sigma-B regulation protein RsbU (phosphoserine phosphatase)
MASPPTSGGINPPSQPGSFFGRAGARIDAFWQRVTEGLQIDILWTQFVAEARASYSLYTREVDWDSLGRERGARRFFKTVSALFWAMIMKLSPARRVFLLIALALVILSFFVNLPQPNGEQRGGFNGVYLLGAAALVFLLALELADRVTMKRDLEIAREIQHWLVPEVPPRVPGVDIAFISRPANTVGGDYYDAFLREGAPSSSASLPLLLVIADVAGKSVPAALLMATFQASLRSLAAAPTSLLTLVEGMNRYSCGHSLGGRRFTTAFFAELDPVTRALTYVRAGHNAPILRRASGQVERLEAGDLPLGIEPNVHYDSAATTLAAGDILVIFTDGLVEAVNEADQEFGELRVLQVLQTSPGENGEKTLRNLLSAVDAFTGPTRQHDDITMLIVRAT